MLFQSANFLLVFLLGDFVLVVQELNTDWWLVQTADGRSTGLVPSPYLNKLPQEGNDEAEKYDDTGKVYMLWIIS